MEIWDNFVQKKPLTSKDMEYLWKNKGMLHLPENPCRSYQLELSKEEEKDWKVAGISDGR